MVAETWFNYITYEMEGISIELLGSGAIGDSFYGFMKLY